MTDHELGAKIALRDRALADARAQIDILTRALAECYRLTGADPDGNEDWRLAPQAVREVSRLRDDHDALSQREITLVERADAAESTLTAAVREARAETEKAISERDEAQRGEQEWVFIAAKNGLDAAERIADAARKARSETWAHALANLRPYHDSGDYGQGLAALIDIWTERAASRAADPTGEQ